MSDTPPSGSTSERPPSETGRGEITNESIVEAILFAAETALPAAKIAEILGTGTARDVRKHVAALNERYGRDGVSFRIENVANGYRMLTLPAYHRWVEKLTRTRSDSRLSRAALETLAIVAYRQPVLRADIEAVRGVQVGDVLNRLREMNLVRIVGRAEEIGRPMLYGTTKRFLELFGLASLDDLPQVEALNPRTLDTPVGKSRSDLASLSRHGGASRAEQQASAAQREPKPEAESQPAVESEPPGADSGSPADAQGPASS